MADNEINVIFNAVTEGFYAGLKDVNAALQATRIKASELKTPVGQLFSTLEKSSDSAIAGMIKGTENWHQASLKIIQDLEIKFAQLAANKLLNELGTDVLGLQSATRTAQGKVDANQTANNAIALSNQQTSDAGSAANASQLIKQIGSDAVAAYSGVYANLSPVLGPAAAIPAGVAYASVAAMEGLVSLDVGAWNLGSDMIAQLHQGEMVVPQNFAQGLRDGSGFGGGDNYTININAIDTQTGTQFLKNNASTIASAISSQVRNFNKNVPAWKS